MDFNSLQLTIERYTEAGAALLIFLIAFFFVVFWLYDGIRKQKD